MSKRIKHHAGDRVIFIPPHAHGSKDHADCERGTVTVNSPLGNVFVKLDGDEGSSKGFKSWELEAE
tara:strand:+ start:18000 stop:18197 length:198 start_codon:yes stop_codon:yes gene_type:complete